MILKPTGLLCSRHEVEQMHAQNRDVTEIDFSDAKVIGGSVMHQFICLFPNAVFTGMNDWIKEEYDWVIKAVEDVSHPDLSLLRHAAEDGGTVAPDTMHDPRRNRGLILAGLGLLSAQPFERDGLTMYRFNATQLGLNVLKKHAGTVLK